MGWPNHLNKLKLNARLAKSAERRCRMKAWKAKTAALAVMSPMCADGRQTTLILENPARSVHELRNLTTPGMSARESRKGEDNDEGETAMQRAEVKTIGPADIVESERSRRR